MFIWTTGTKKSLYLEPISNVLCVYLDWTERRIGQLIFIYLTEEGGTAALTTTRLKLLAHFLLPLPRRRGRLFGLKSVSRTRSRSHLDTQDRTRSRLWGEENKRNGTQQRNTIHWNNTTYTEARKLLSLSLGVNVTSLWIRVRAALCIHSPVCYPSSDHDFSWWKGRVRSSSLSFFRIAYFSYTGIFFTLLFWLFFSALGEQIDF